MSRPPFLRASSSSLAHVYTAISAAPLGTQEAQRSCPRLSFPGAPHLTPTAQKDKGLISPQALPGAGALGSEVEEPMLLTPLPHPLVPHHLKSDPTDSNCTHPGPFTCGTFGHQSPPSCSVGWPKFQEGHIHPARSPLSQRHRLPHPSSHQPCCMLHAVAQRPCGTRLQHPLPRMTSLEKLPLLPPCLAIPLPHSSSRD